MDGMIRVSGCCRCVVCVFFFIRVGVFVFVCWRFQRIREQEFGHVQTSLFAFRAGMDCVESHLVHEIVGVGTFVDS